MAVFPGGVKSFTAKTDGVDDVLAAHVNEIQDEVEAIETELLNPWIDYSATSTVTGFSGALTTRVVYVHRDPLRKIVHVIAFLAGTSNATTLTFTVPANCAANTTVSVMCAVMDSGSRSHGTATVNSSTVSVNKDLFQAFTASGNKEVRLSMWWFIA